MANGNDEQEDLGTYAAAKSEFSAKYKALDLLPLVKELIKADQIKAEHKKRHTRAQAACDLLRMELIPNKMIAANQQTVTFKGVGRVALHPDLLISVKAGMKNKLCAWLRKNRLGDLIQGTVNSSTLRAWAKERMQKGKDVPRALLNVTPITRASITRV
jgi:hypothetical protein